MLTAIFTALLCAVAPTAQAAGQQARPLTSVPGAPGTATPTPYPQVTPNAPPQAGGSQPGAPLLPPMPLPGPPKDQPLPGLEPVPAPGKED